MKIKEDKKSLHSKTLKQLYIDLVETREKVAYLKRDLSFGKLKSPHKLKREKKKIAFILTIIREKTEKELEKNEKRKLKKS